jgi:DNA-damage-inducible protein J
MKDATVTARIDSELKHEAESILRKIGLNSSTAIGLFYNSVVLNKGLPFRLRLDSVPNVSYAEQKDIEKILKKRSKKDKEIVSTESFEVEI